MNNAILTCNQIQLYYGAVIYELYILKPMKINISEVTREWLLEYPQYEMEERSAIKIKVSATRGQGHK